MGPEVPHFCSNPEHPHHFRWGPDCDPPSTPTDGLWCEQVTRGLRCLLRPGHYGGHSMSEGNHPLDAARPDPAPAGADQPAWRKASARLAGAMDAHRSDWCTDGITDDDGQRAGEWCDPCPLDWAGRHKVGDHVEDREGR